MAKSASPQILALLKMHQGELVTIIIAENDNISAQTGVISAVYNDGITISDNLKYKPNQIIPFEIDEKNKILEIYNKLNIDLVIARETKPLSTKIMNRDLQKIIIQNLKPYINKNVFFVFKKNLSISTAKGKFEDMGTSGLMFKQAPLFNETRSLTYNTILHMYNDEFVDLIA